MGILEDVMKAIERIPGWKRIAATPDELDALKKRVEELEAKLSPPSGEICPICRSPSLKVISSKPHPVFSFAGKKVDTLQCSSCGHKEDRNRD